MLKQSWYFRSVESINAYTFGHTASSYQVSEFLVATQLLPNKGPAIS